MTSSHSSFNFKFLKEEYRKYNWLIFLSAFILLFSKIMFPILNIVNAIKLDKSLDFVNEFLSLTNIENKVSIIALGFIFGIYMFSYLHDIKETDFYHAIPINRKKLFLSKYLLGIVMALPIILIFQFILYFIDLMVLKQAAVSFKYVLLTLGVDIFFFLVIYSITTFSTIFSGGKLVSFIVSLNIMSIFSVFDLILRYLFTILNPHYSSLYTVYNDSLNILANPLAAYFSISILNEYNLSMYLVLFVNLVIFGLFTIFAFVLFINRRSEKSNSMIAFNVGYIIFKYYMTFLCGICSGIIFYIISGINVFLYIGLILGCVFSYIIFQSLYDRDLGSGLKKSYNSILSIALGALFFISIELYSLDLSKYLPKSNDVKFVNVTIPEYSSIMVNLVESKPIQNNIYDRNFIDEILSLQKNFIKNIGNINYSNENETKDFIVFRVYFDISGRGDFVSNIVLDINDPKIKELADRIRLDSNYLEVNFPFIYNNDVRNSVKSIKILDGKYVYNNEINNGIVLDDLLNIMKYDIENGLINQGGENSIRIYINTLNYRFALNFEQGSKTFDYLKKNNFI